MNNTKIFLLSGILFIAALFGIFYYYMSNSVSAGQPKFALASIGRLISESEMGKDLTEQISDMSKAFSDEYTEAYKSLGKMQEELKGKQSVMSEEEFENAQLNIFAAQNQLRALADEFRNKTVEIFNRMTKYVADEVSDMLPDLMKDHGFSLLFRDDQQNIYFNKSLSNMMDITSDVRSKLDDESEESPINLSQDTDEWKKKIREVIEKAKAGELAKNNN